MGCGAPVPADCDCMRLSASPPWGGKLLVPDVGERPVPAPVADGKELTVATEGSTLGTFAVVLSRL